MPMAGVHWPPHSPPVAIGNSNSNMNLQVLARSGIAMAAAFGPVLLLLASVLLSGVMMLAIYGIVELIYRYHRRRSDGSLGLQWREQSMIRAARHHDSLAAPEE
jgi:hypothetical protein